MDNSMARLLKWAGTLAFAAFSTMAFATPCDPEENTWIPSRYYPPGKTVFHNGNWYESRELQEGKTPGADFEWKKLDSAPDCGKQEAKPVIESTDSEPGQARARNQKHPVESGNKTSQACNEPGSWSFGASYTVGQMAVHEGQAYRAIRPSNGQMPGMSQPPHWKPIENPCEAQSEKVN